ncbi:DUF1016 N-terminal domain-containing protein [Collinsella tanakaei]|uniref:DUF1016 N-terminal domain-containing protein n=1 Tax=Collinsella tanakaei TaxID=626935 RepID=UPI0022E153D7|nr:DUF1016 N-terminal domain-containing protein [Collinsella tanakaei]
MRQFYLTFPIRHTLRAELNWSHCRLLMRVDSEQRRLWYMDEAADAGRCKPRDGPSQTGSMPN